MGYEWDALQEGLEPAEATVFFHYENELSNADGLSAGTPPARGVCGGFAAVQPGV